MTNRATIRKTAAPSTGHRDRAAGSVLASGVWGLVISCPTGQPLAETGSAGAMDFGAHLHGYPPGPGDTSLVVLPAPEARLWHTGCGTGPCAAARGPPARYP